MTGKFFYDLQDQQNKLEREDVALVRVEQLFPLPSEQIRAILINIKMLTTLFGHKKNHVIWEPTVICLCI